MYRSVLAFFLLAASAFSLPEVDNKSLERLERGGISMEVPRKISYAGSLLCWKGSGVRKKKVVIAWVKVYELHRYEPCSGAAYPQVLRLVFLRDVDQEKIRSSFRDALEENSVPSAKGSALGDLLENWDRDMKEKETLWIVGKSTAKGQRVELMAGTALMAAEGATAATDLWKIWLGKPVDSGLEELKAQLQTGTSP